MSLRKFLRLAALCLIVPACAKSAIPSPWIGHPTGAGQLVMRVQNSGGLINPAAQANQLPEFSLYGNGDAIAPGAQPAVYPGPALTEPIVDRLSAGGVQAILEAARRAGLFANNVSSGPGVPDTGTTVITVVAGDHTYVSRYLGLSPTGADARVSAFVGRLRYLKSWLPAGSVLSSGTYAPSSIAVAVSRYHLGSGPSEPAIAWPLSTPLEGFGAPFSAAGQGVSCGVISGNDLAKLMPGIGGANQLTPWTSSGRPYALAFRPLLPDQTGC
jgi:hypothetical protein